MKQLFLCILFFGIYSLSSAQVGINNTDPKAALDISAGSTPSATDGILIPRVDEYPTGVNGDQNGMFVFLTGAGAPAQGLYYWDQASTLWIAVTGAKRIDELADGKSDSDGSEDGSSVFLGVSAGAADDSTNNRNVGVGYQVLEDNTSGDQNTALGYHSLWNNIDGSANTAVGSASLAANTTGIWNTAVGQAALDSNVDGAYNTALGRAALAGNTDGNSNVALGVNALVLNSSGSFNTIIGTDTAGALASGSSNTAIGRRAMNSFTSGSSNVAVGVSAGYYGSGDENTYIGTTAGFTVGAPARSGSVFLGFGAGSGELTDNKLYIENSASATPLIYGEFDTDILRVNGTLQVSNPTGTGYAFPVADGTVGQVLTTDGAGAVSWSTAAVAITSADNGLTETSGNVRLGGALVQNTTITQGAFNHIYNLSSGGEFIVQDNGTPALIVNNNGFVGIGENANTPVYALNVEDSRSNSYVANFENNSSGSDADGISVRSGAGSSNNHFIGFYRFTGANSGSVRGAGSGVNYATTSDRRLKMNIEDIDQALELIKNMQPRWYRYKEFPKQEEYGFIAQELQSIYPQAVSGSPESDVTTDPMMVDYGRLTPILTAGIKELHAKVEILETENQKLKQQLQKFEKLEARISALEREKR